MTHGEVNLPRAGAMRCGAMYLVGNASKWSGYQLLALDGAVKRSARKMGLPLASVTGGPVSRLTSKELLRLAREEGQARGGRVLRSARSGRVPRARRRPR